MKKLIAAILALTLVLSLSGAAFAAEAKPPITAPGSQNVTITASIAPTYAVTIPANVNVTFNQPSTDFGKIELTTAKLEPNSSVKVDLNASGELKNQTDSTKVIAYTIKDKATASKFTTANYEAAGDSTNLTIEITQAAWDSAVAGTYSDTVTFTVSYVSPTP